MIGHDVIVRDLLVVACAISAGIHAALAPAHLEDGAAAGAGFAGSAVVLAVLAVALTRSPRPVVLVAAALTLAGLIAAYALAVSTGVPLVQPDQEAPDGLGLVTKAIELAGLGAALHLLRWRRAIPVRLPARPRGL